MANKKKTPCKKCGKFDFEQRYHAIIKGVGYIDADGDFVEETNDVLEITNGIELFKCLNCGEEAEIKPDQDEDGG